MWGLREAQGVRHSTLQAFLLNLAKMQYDAQVEDAEKRIGALVWDHRVADEKHADEVKDLSANLAAAGAEKLALQRGFEARLAAMKGELSRAQDSVAGAAAKTEETLTWQHSSIFQTTKTKPSGPVDKQVCATPCLLAHS